MTSGLTYPYTKHDRLIGTNLDHDLEFSPGTLPPSGTAGGAGRFKYWVDSTDVNNGILRQCVVNRATAGVYISTEWITLGVIDAGNHKFHFNTDSVDFTGGSGSLTIHELTVTGGTHLNTLDVSGATNLNTLAVAGTLTVGGASTLHATSIIGNLSVSGQIAGGTLAISGASALHDLGVTGNETVSGALTVTGAITGGSLNTAGNMTVGGSATIGSLASLHVTGNAQIDGTLGVTGAITGASTITGTTITGSTLASSGAITGTTLATTGAINAGTTITGTTITGSTLASSGAITGATLTTSGAIAAGTSITGVDLNMSHTISAGTTIYAAGDISSDAHVRAVECLDFKLEGITHRALCCTRDVPGFPLLGNISVYLNGPTFDTAPPSTQVCLYDDLNLYCAVTHHIQGKGGSAILFATISDGNTSNQTGSWSIISDDSVKENIVPYTRGLAEILQLDPISFNYFVATAATKYERYSPFADKEGEVPRIRYGFLASEVRAVLPEMTSQVSYGVNPMGLPMTPLWTISPTHLVYVLTNAVKELSATDDGLDARLDIVEAHTPPVIVLSGDVSGSGTPNIPTTLAMVNATPGVFQGLTVDAKGRVTAATNMHYAPLDSPALTGVPTAPTPANTVATTQLATTAFVRLGTTTNDNALAGQIGEFISGQLLSTAAVSLPSGVDTSIATVSLTAGEWEVWGSGGFTLSGNNATQLKAWVNPTGATVAPSNDQVGGLSIMPVTNNVTQMILPVTPMRVSLAAAATMRLGASGTFTGTISVWGKIMARRVR